jgi:hypothetical protein
MNFKMITAKKEPSTKIKLVGYGLTKENKTGV